MKSRLIIVFLLFAVTDITWAQLETDYPVSQITFGNFRDAHPVFSPDSKSIAFDSDRNGMSSLFVYSLDDSLTQTIPSDKKVLFSPAWTPDGKNLIAIQKVEAGQLLFETDIKKRLKPLLKRQVVFESVVFNPNGNLLAFAGKTPNDTYWKLMSYDFKYDNLNEIVKLDQDIKSPRWSPKGTFLSYHTKKSAPATGNEIRITHWNGSPFATISNDTIQLSDACWGPGIGKIACIGKDEKGYWLLSCKPDGSNLQKIAFSIYEMASPDWSKDEKKIVVSLADENLNFHLWIIHMDINQY